MIIDGVVGFFAFETATCDGFFFLVKVYSCCTYTEFLGLIVQSGSFAVYKTFSGQDA